MNKAVKELLERELAIEQERLKDLKGRIITMERELDEWKRRMADSEGKICEITLFLKESN